MSRISTDQRQPKRLVFMGSHPIALPVLNWMADNASHLIQIVGVVTQPDRRTGRGMKLAPNPIKEWAAINHYPIFQPEKADGDLEGELKLLKCEMILVMAYGQLLRKSLINLPSLGTLNLHASLLPELRGASPLHTAIASGYERSGVTLMRIEPQMDSGPIVDQEIVAIEPTWTTDDLTMAMAHACPPLIKRNVQNWVNDQMPEKIQNPNEVSYCRILKKEDASLDFQSSAQELYHRIRAFQPWPGTTFLHNNQEIKIREATYSMVNHDKPAGSIEVVENRKFTIFCGKGCLHPTQLQKPGSRIMAVDDFLRGYRFDANEVLKSRPMEVLVSTNGFKLKKKIPQG